MNDMCTDNRFELIEKYKKELVEATNIETSPEEMLVLDNILFRFWQMGWLESIDRMPLVKESALTLMHSGGDSVYAKALRNAGRFIQNAIDGEPPEFEKLPSVKPRWIPTSKERPPQHQELWITDVYGDVEVVYRGDGILWHSNGDNGYYFGDEIIAWMPANVPEPYQPEEESE